MRRAPRSGLCGLLTVLGLCLAVFVGTGCGRSETSNSAHGTNQSELYRRGRITFNRDIAPIVFQHCAPCHRAGLPAPFSLLTYLDAQKHAADMVKVTQARYMPPWLPEPGFGEFVGERKLSVDQIDLIRQWVDEGAVEGAASDLPVTPKWPEGWELGQPDLVLELSPPYTLGAAGKDIHRNFVIPVSLPETVYVRAVEVRPENRSVHHVRILIDQSGESRLRDQADAEPGFDGMRPPAKFPLGHMLTWAPGKSSFPEPAGLSWTLEKDTDIVLQMHLQRTGKTESLQPKIGLYFTNQPPAKSALMIGLLSQLIDIAPDETNYVAERSFKLPVPVQVLGVLPHLHYLGNEVQAFAELPDGTRKWLLLIKHWDFNWQGEYRYTHPVNLPAGARIAMRYTYDNSDRNIRNPSHPPRRVRFGPQSTDEMGELWLQVLPGSASDWAVLQREKMLLDFRETAAFYENFLREHPDDAPAHVGLGKVLGPLGQAAAAAPHFRAALKLDPRQAEAHYYLGLVHLEAREFEQARAAFEEELRVNPAFYKAHVGLSMVAIEAQNLALAEAHARAALRISPKISGLQELLDRIVKAKAKAKP